MFMTVLNSTSKIFLIITLMTIFSFAVASSLDTPEFSYSLMEDNPQVEVFIDEDKVDEENYFGFIDNHERKIQEEELSRIVDICEQNQIAFDDLNTAIRDYYNPDVIASDNTTYDLEYEVNPFEGSIDVFYDSDVDCETNESVHADIELYYRFIENYQYVSSSSKEINLPNYEELGCEDDLTSCDTLSVDVYLWATEEDEVYHNNFRGKAHFLPKPNVLQAEGKKGGIVELKFEPLSVPPQMSHYEVDIYEPGDDFVDQTVEVEHSEEEIIETEIDVDIASRDEGMEYRFEVMPTPEDKENFHAEGSSDPVYAVVDSKPPTKHGCGGIISDKEIELTFIEDGVGVDKSTVSPDDFWIEGKHEVESVEVSDWEDSQYYNFYLTLEELIDNDSDARIYVDSEEGIKDNYGNKIKETDPCELSDDINPEVLDAKAKDMSGDENFDVVELEMSKRVRDNLPSKELFELKKDSGQEIEVDTIAAGGGKTSNYESGHYIVLIELEDSQQFDSEPTMSYTELDLKHEETHVRDYSHNYLEGTSLEVELKETELEEEQEDMSEDKEDMNDIKEEENQDDQGDEENQVEEMEEPKVESKDNDTSKYNESEGEEITDEKEDVGQTQEEEKEEALQEYEEERVDDLESDLEETEDEEEIEETEVDVEKEENNRGDMNILTKFFEIVSDILY